MTKHNSQQSGGRCDWSMTPLEMSKFHTDMLVPQHSLSSSCLWAFMNYEIKKSTPSSFSALKCSILNYVFKILDILNFIVSFRANHRVKIFKNFIKRSLE